MIIHSLDIEEVYKTLLSSLGGLTPQEAARRLSEYGPNEIRAARKKPLYLRFVAQFTHFLAVLLWIAAALCALSELIRPGEGMLLLAAAIVGVIFVNAVFTFVQEYRAEKAVEALKKLLPFKVKAVRGGSVVEVRSEEVAPGDVILLSEGDKVPADARLVESGRLTVNNAPLTGESEPRPRSDAPFDGEYLDSPNIVFAGTLDLGGTGRAVVYATGMPTEFGRIAHLTGSVEPGLSPLQKEIIRATRIIAVIAVTTGLFFFGIGLAMGRGFWHNFLFAVGIIIANVPEGLLPTVTLALAMGSQRMAKKNALIKTLTSVETLGSVTVICTDKTGTLTENRMEVKDIWTPDGDRRMLLAAAMHCSNAAFEDGRFRGDPTETALMKAAMQEAGVPDAMRIFDIPFDPEKKRMLTVHEMDGGRFVFVKGALEAVLPLCNMGAGAEEELYGNFWIGQQVADAVGESADLAEEPGFTVVRWCGSIHGRFLAFGGAGAGRRRVDLPPPGDRMVHGMSGLGAAPSQLASSRRGRSGRGSCAGRARPGPSRTRRSGLPRASRTRRLGPPTCGRRCLPSRRRGG